MKHRAAPPETGLQLVRQSIAAEFNIKIPQHFGLGEGERPISGVRNRPEEILRQPEQRLEGAQQAAAVTVARSARRWPKPAPASRAPSSLRWCRMAADKRLT